MTQPSLLTAVRGLPQPVPAAWQPEVPSLLEERRIVLNAETTGLRWWAGDRAVGWSWWLPESDRHGYLPMRHQGGGNLPEEQVLRFLQNLRGLRIDNINTKFDIHIARNDGVDLTAGGNTFGDVAHQAALLDDYRRRFNLDQLSDDVLGWRVEETPLGKLPKGITSEYEFQFLPAWVVTPYAVRNVQQVKLLIDRFQPQIEEEGLTKVLHLERDIIPVVVEMEKNGTWLDMPLLEQWHARCKQDIAACLMEVFRLTGVRMASPDSSKDQLRVFQARGIPITEFTATGKPSFTAGVLAAHREDLAIRAMERAGHLADLESKFLGKFVRNARADGWLRFNLHQLRSTKGDDESQGAVSGRFSAAGDRLPPDGTGSGGYNPQQCVAVEKQLERGWCPDYVLRKLFRAQDPKTHKVLASDMMQVEYRMFAHYAGLDAPYHAAPRQRTIDGKEVWVEGPEADFHAVVWELLNVPSLNRKKTKNVNFMKIYGGGSIKFAFMLGLITEAVFKELTERSLRGDRSVYNDPRLAESNKLNLAYNNRFPQVAPLLRQASTLAEQRGYVSTIYGRRARLVNRFHSALNRVIQGGAADINKLCLVDLHAAAKDLGIILRLTVHDETVTDIARDADPARVTALLNEQRIPLRVPILWDTHVGDTWADCK